MAHEDWPAGIVEPEWDIVVPEMGGVELECALMDIFNRHKEMTKQPAAKLLKYKWEPGHSLSLDTDFYGNSLFVGINNKDKSQIGKIGIGYFSPADGEFLLYPEYVDSEKSEMLLRDEALFKRAQAITNFNQNGRRGATRVDYSHPVVQGVHRSHRQLLGTSEIKSILEHRNFDNMNAPEIFCDEVTRAAIYLRKGYTGSPSTKAYIDMGVRILGAFNTIADVDRRIESQQLIDIAKRGPGTSAEERLSFIPKKAGRGSYIGEYLVSTFLEQAETVADLDELSDEQAKELGGKFDPIRLGLTVGRQTAS